MCVLFQELEFLLDVFVALVRLAMAARALVQFYRFFPRASSASRFAEAGEHVAQVIPDDRILGPAWQCQGFLQLFAGAVKLAATEEDPAQTINIVIVVQVAVHLHSRTALAL